MSNTECTPPNIELGSQGGEVAVTTNSAEEVRPDMVVDGLVPADESNLNESENGGEVNDADITDAELLEVATEASAKVKIIKLQVSLF